MNTTIPRFDAIHSVYNKLNKKPTVESLAAELELDEPYVIDQELAKISDSFSYYFALELITDFNSKFRNVKAEYLKCFKFYEYFIRPHIKSQLLSACKNEKPGHYQSFKNMFCVQLLNHLQKHNDQISSDTLLPESQQALNNAIDTIAVNVLKEYKNNMGTIIGNGIISMLKSQQFKKMVHEEHNA